MSVSRSRAAPGQTLLLDADDTLWENHALFIRVQEDFLARLAARGHAREHVLRILMGLERERCARTGYGSLPYAESLEETSRILEGRVDEEERVRIRAACRWIHDHPVQPFPGVAETLDDLQRRHRLLLVTKGQVEEQEAKVARSGLGGFFETVQVLHEKAPAAYTTIIERFHLDPASTWMVGNSPRSDILPAREAGLWTVHIPHRSLWELERAELDGEADITLERFREMVLHF